MQHEAARDFAILLSRERIFEVAKYFHRDFQQKCVEVSMLLIIEYYHVCGLCALWTVWNKSNNACMIEGETKVYFER